MTQQLIQTCFDWFHKLKLEHKYFSLFLVIGILGAMDFATGYEFSFSFFYMIPVSIATWFISTRIGIYTAIACSLLWMVLDLQSGHTFTQMWFPLWNATMRFGFYMVVVKLLEAVNMAFEKERQLSRTDFLTGAYNRRYAYEIIEGELDRYNRYKGTFVLAYFDLDNFKKVNDTMGHAEGDEVLKVVTALLREKLRKTDSIGRMGGDEFLVLMPETNLQTGEKVLIKLQKELVEEMQKRNWPITFSMGAVAPIAQDKTVTDLIERADELMYKVKTKGKNSLLIAA